MLDALAHHECLRERTLSERGLVVGEVHLVPDLGGVWLAPGILAIGMRREIERLASGLERLRKAHNDGKP
jgi:hypothetical protein